MPRRLLWDVRSDKGGIRFTDAPSSDGRAGPLSRSAAHVQATSSTAYGEEQAYFRNPPLVLLLISESDSAGNQDSKSR